MISFVVFCFIVACIGLFAFSKIDISKLDLANMGIKKTEEFLGEQTTVIRIFDETGDAYPYIIVELNPEIKIKLEKEGVFIGEDSSFIVIATNDNPKLVFHLLQSMYEEDCISTIRDLSKGRVPSEIERSKKFNYSE